MSFIDTNRANKIMNEWGYESFTALQRVVLEKCQYKNGAREFIIGSTSSGKTAIPLVCYKESLIEGEIKAKMLYMVPYRALATQKERELRKKFPDCKVIVSTSEYCANDINVMNANCDIAIVIYEKVYLFASNNKNFFEKYSHIVFDELGIVESPERGLKVDYILALACTNPDSNIYVLATPYFDWTKYINAYSFLEHKETSRPIEIKNTVIYYVLGDKGNELNELDDKVLAICSSIDESKKILVFANSRKRVQELSRKISLTIQSDKSINVGEAKRNFLDRIIMTDDDLYGIYDNEDYLAYEKGVAFHNASLPEEIREVIEEDFLSDNGGIRIVVSTETLAYGLNSNVDVVIVADMDKPTGKSEKRFLTVNEYQNYIGRAGRLGKSSRGDAYTCIQVGEQEYKWELLAANSNNPDVIESEYCNIWQKDECVFLLLNFFDAKNGISTQEVKRKLLQYPCEIDVLDTDMDDAIQKLLERKLIIEAYDELEDEKKYTVSKIGKRALGFVVSIDTYDRLVITAEGFSQKRFYAFDFLLSVCKCKELQISDYYTPKEAVAYRHHFMEFINRLEEAGAVSRACKKGITTNVSFEKFRKETGKFTKNDFDILRQIRMAEALYMWMDCFSSEEIKKICGFEYSTVKKIGEKAKYITDIVSADISFSKHSDDLEIQLKRIGLSLYYGIYCSFIEKLNVLEIEPADGRMLRTIGRIYNIEHSNSKKNGKKLEILMDHIKNYPMEYIKLLEE